MSSHVMSLWNIPLSDIISSTYELMAERIYMCEMTRGVTGKLHYLTSGQKAFIYEVCSIDKDKDRCMYSIVCG